MLSFWQQAGLVLISVAVGQGLSMIAVFWTHRLGAQRDRERWEHERAAEHDRWEREQSRAGVERRVQDAREQMEKCSVLHATVQTYVLRRRLGRELVGPDEWDMVRLLLDNWAILPKAHRQPIAEAMRASAAEGSSLEAAEKLGDTVTEALIAAQDDYEEALKHRDAALETGKTH